MAEKKVTKKTTKKADAPAHAGVKEPIITAEKKTVEVEVKAPAYVSPEDLAERLDEEDISKEIAEALKEVDLKSDRYYQAIGRRKTAVARIRLYTKGDKEFIVNDESYQKYFDLAEDQENAVASMKKMKCLDKFRVTVVVKGGGHSAQAEAIRHGTARVLVDFNANFRKRLRKAGFLTRDPRMRERKKFGRKRARKSPQWAKR